MTSPNLHTAARTRQDRADLARVARAEKHVALLDEAMVDMRTGQVYAARTKLLLLRSDLASEAAK
jgi:hypothetical protein